MPLAFSGTLSIQIASLDPIEISGVGVAEVVSVGGAIVQLSLPAGVFVGSGVVTAPTELAPMVQLGFSVSNAAIVLSAAQLPCDVADPALSCVGVGPLHGRAGLSGLATGGLLGSVGSPLTTLALAATPIGGGGSFHGTNTLLGVGVRLVGAGWTTGTAIALGTLSGSPAHVLVATGSATGGLTGSLQLVTPFAIRSDVGEATVAGLANIHLDFVPEPASGSLVAAGLVALGLGARRRRRV